MERGRLALVLKRSPRYTLLLLACLIPAAAAFQGSGVNVNYAFALLPLFAVGFRFNLPATLLISLAAISALYAQWFIFTGDGDRMLRQTASMALFCLPLLLLYCRFSFGLREITSAVIIASAIYAVSALSMIYFGDYSLLAFYDIKNDLGMPAWPQQFVVIQLFGLFFAIGRRYYLVAATILVCIFFTFTRAAWLGVAVGMVALLLPRGRNIKIPVLLVVGVTAAMLLSETISEALVDVATRTYTGILYSATDSLSPDAISETGRLLIWGTIVNTVMETNPLLGLGGGNIYLVAPQVGGSAHSQYMDVFVRFGILGLMLYTYFWLRILKFYFTRNAHVFAALCAVGVFGVFSETTNLSYVAPVFFLLLNLTYHRLVDHVRNGPGQRAGAKVGVESVRPG